MNAVIHRYVQEGIHVVTDMWGGFNELKKLCYVRSTVNHSENYVDTKTNSHTREIEGA